jgi:hypothetical protein
VEYLEAAFLIKVVHRVDRNARRFERANFFKVYLTNPSIRSALFSPIDAGDDAMGGLAETAIFSQWFHAPATPLHYARWSTGEVDIVNVGPDQRIRWAVEVNWSDRFVDHPRELRSLLDFCAANGLTEATVTTRTVFAEREVNGVNIQFIPASVYCYQVGYHLVLSRRIAQSLVP